MSAGRDQRIFPVRGSRAWTSFSPSFAASTTPPAVYRSVYRELLSMTFFRQRKTAFGGAEGEAAAGRDECAAPALGRRDDDTDFHSAAAATAPAGTAATA